MRDKWRGDLFILAVGLVVLVLDQVAKHWITANMEPYESIPQDGWIRLTYVTNTGSAFGLLQGQTILYFLIAAAMVAMVFIYRRVLSSDAPAYKLAVGLQLGGAVGNLVDRLRVGHVVDFVDLRVWPVFNVADSAIVVGVAVLAYFLVFPPRGESVGSRPPEGACSEGNG